MTATEDVPDDVIATLSDYLDGTLPEAQRADVATKIEHDPIWKRGHEEMLETREAVRSQISTLRRAQAPQTFAEDVTSTIEKRSAGRFFGRKTFGDRVPFGVILIVALIALGVLAITLRSSPTGSLKNDKKHRDPPKQSEPLLKY